MSSFTLLAGTEGLTTSTIGTEAASAIGAKSFSMSNGSLAYSAGFMVTWLEAMTMV